MANNIYDALVVGSGISGGWAAIKDYTEASKEAWDYPHRGERTQQMIKNYPVLKRDYPLNERNLSWWANDQDSPYTEIKRFDWFRGYHVGGRSLLWGRQTHRLRGFYF